MGGILGVGGDRASWADEALELGVGLARAVSRALSWSSLGPSDFASTSCPSIPDMLCCTKVLVVVGSVFITSLSLMVVGRVVLRFHGFVVERQRLDF